MSQMPRRRRQGVSQGPRNPIKIWSFLRICKKFCGFSLLQLFFYGEHILGKFYPDPSRRTKQKENGWGMFFDRGWPYHKLEKIWLNFHKWRIIFITNLIDRAFMIQFRWESVSSFSERFTICSMWKTFAHVVFFGLPKVRGDKDSKPRHPHSLGPQNWRFPWSNLSTLSLNRTYLFEKPKKYGGFFLVGEMGARKISGKSRFLENIGKYHFFRQLWLVLGVKLMEINSNLFSRLVKYYSIWADLLNSFMSICHVVFWRVSHYFCNTPPKFNIHYSSAIKVVKVTLKSTMRWHSFRSFLWCISIELPFWEPQLVCRLDFQGVPIVFFWILQRKRKSLQIELTLGDSNDLSDESLAKL